MRQAINNNPMVQVAVLGGLDSGIEGFVRWLLAAWVRSVLIDMMDSECRSGV